MAASAEPSGGNPTRAVLVRLSAVLGMRQTPLRLRVLQGFLIGIAALVVVLGVVTRPLHSAAPGLGGLAIAAGLVAVAQVARVRVRIGIVYLSLGWGEAAVIVALYVAPPGWVPLAVLVGAAVAMTVLRLAGEARAPISMIYNAASLSLAGAAAAVVTMLIRPPFHAPVDLRLVAALVAGGVAYTAVGLLPIAASVSLRTGTRFREVAWRAASGKLFMIVGNIAIGVLIVVMVGASLLWLMVLPPVLWLLRQSYAYQLRADDERRGWRVFAGVTRSLNRLDERGVAEAGVAGAAQLFPVESAEVRVLRPDDTVWSYQGSRGPEVLAGPVRRVGDSDPALVTVRALQVGGAGVGELRLHYAKPLTLSPRERMQLSAFGDALAAALHDAASHQELKALTVRSSHEAVHDPLTGIANRAALLSKGNAALRELDGDVPVALLLLDVDHFKEVNDTLGHAAGDELLKVTATRVAGYCRDGELAARLGGDEFGLLLTALPAPEDVQAIDDVALEYGLCRARELADVLAVPTEVAGVPLAIEASVGVVVALAGACDMTELLRRADIAMYQAKRGAGAVAWYDSAGDVGSTDRLALLAELREALDSSEQLALVLQPVIDLQTGGPTGVEALIRWRHPRRGELGPDEFIDVLENSDLVTPFTRYVVERALAIAADWGRHGITLPISVNLSPRSLLDRRLPGEVAGLLAKHGLPAQRLVFEITETVVVPEYAVVTEVLDGLRDLGVQLAVDDFGTGYSSLTFLTRVHVDEVKIDRTFVARMVESPEALAIVRTTIDLARELGLRVIAEGVETAAQRVALVELGCDCAQGYHFAVPMAPEKIVGVLGSLARGAGGRVIPLRAEGAL